jgi:hypothetical protein
MMVTVPYRAVSEKYRGEGAVVFDVLNSPPQWFGVVIIWFCLGCIEYFLA